VALNEAGLPTEVPRLKLETEEDIRRSDEARLRVRVRERVRDYWKRKYAANAPTGKPTPRAMKALTKDSVPKQLVELVTTVREVVDRVPFLRNKKG
jgi:hypothetical protein